VSLRRALVAAATDLYHQTWRLIVLNALLGAVLLGVILASLAMRPAMILAVLLGPVAAAVMHCAVTLAQTEELRLSEVVVGLRRHWRRGLALGAFVTAAGLLGVVAVAFWSRAGPWGWPFAALCVYLLLMFAVFQLALWPLAVFEEARPFRAVIRDATGMVLRRPAGFGALGLALFLVNAAGMAAAILPFLTLTVAYSFLVSAHFALPKNPAREA
jgi:hypothetical protein